MNEPQNILIVDDSDDDRFMLRQLLKSLDAEIIEATSGAQALELTLNQQVAVAIVSAKMPGMGGVELACRLRADQHSKHTPILVMTAYHADELSEFKGYEGGGIDFLFKPYLPEILQSKVNLFLEMARDKQELQSHRNELERLVEQRTTELSELNTALQRSNQQLEQFASVISHDLQEPLRMIENYIRLLEKRYHGRLDPDADDFINFAVDGAKRMQRMINDLLILSQVATHNRPLEVVDCSEVVAEALLDLSYVIQETRANVQTSPLPKVRANRSQLLQVFRNLIGNALKFHGEAPPWIDITVEGDGKDWIFTIADKGIGIDPKNFDRMFTIFQRLHVKEQYPGTGMGLAIVKRIIKCHDGRIWVESQPGAGSRFRFTLPAEK